MKIALNWSSKDANNAKYLDHEYETKCKVSPKDNSWQISQK